jgi:transcriptional regulator with XRE-family HTH domain
MAANDTALVAQRLRLLREKHGLSYRELAILCGLGETQVYKYERGDNEPSALSLKLIAKKLDVSVDYLLGLTDDPKSHYSSNEITDQEKDVLEAFRHDGWAGIARLGVEKLAKLVNG